MLKRPRKNWDGKQSMAYWKCAETPGIGRKVTLKVIKIKKNQIEYKIKVIDLPKSRIGAKLVALYVIDMTEKDQYDILKMRKSAQDYYRQKGLGRPTKKDRREMDDFSAGSSASEMDNDDWDVFFSPDTEETED